MQGKCLYCGVEQNLTERLCKGYGCKACGRPLKAALAEVVAQAVGMTVLMSEDFGANSVAVGRMLPFRTE